MVSFNDYSGREQSYVKHVFLESYLERLVHKVASKYAKIAYIDGFAGPWQSANERFEDTSFGIALNALRRARASWKAKQRDVRMFAFLVEQDQVAYQRLAGVPAKYPDVSIRTYNDDFMKVFTSIVRSIPEQDTFAFFLLDPKGWRIPLRSLQPLLARPNSEIVFNFMFDFINRAASMKDPSISAGLNELIPFGDWRERLEAVERAGVANPEVRKGILIDGFSESLKRLGNYEYVAETTVLRPLKDRPLYCLFYATRHPRGIEVFRDCQVAALEAESNTRAAAKVQQTARATGQGELFESLHDMAPDKLKAFLQDEVVRAEKTIIELAPASPRFISYGVLRARVQARHIVRFPDVNGIAARLRRENRLLFPDWEKGKKVPQPLYRTQRGQSDRTNGTTHKQG